MIHLATECILARLAVTMPSAALELVKPVELPDMRLNGVGDAAFTWAHILYRLRNVASELLYVGITNDLRARFAAHSREQPWWHEVVSCAVEFWPNRVSLENEEVRIIQIERPLYNKRPGWVVQASGAVTPTRRGSKMEFAMDGIIRIILDERLREGDRLPSQAELCSKFAISTVTLRAALLKLSTFGLITTSQGRGCYAAVSLCPQTEVEALTDVICGKWEA